MNSLWILPFFLTLISAVRHSSMECYDKGRGKFKFYITGKDKINNIFSTDPEHSCSLSNNDFIGNGTEASPYEISIDINSSRKSYKPCGAKMITSLRWRVEFVTKTFEDFFGKDDTVEFLNCPIDIQRNRHYIVGSHKLSYNRDNPNIGPMTMNLVSANSEDIPEGGLLLGQKVKLRIEIPENSDAKHGRVTLCYVHNTHDDNSKRIFYNTKCSNSSYPVPVKFVTNGTNPKLIESTEFGAFQLHDNAKFQFTCYVEVCVKERDSYCSDTDCVQLGTFLHPYKEVKSLVYSFSEYPEAKSGATNMISFMLMPIAAVMVIFTKIDWF